MIKYEVFALGPNVNRLDKGRNILLDNVEIFANKIGEKNIVAITSLLNTIIVWYRD